MGEKDGEGIDFEKGQDEGDDDDDHYHHCDNHSCEFSDDGELGSNTSCVDSGRGSDHNDANQDHHHHIRNHCHS